MEKPKTVAIIGGGPVGLAAAAHLLERGVTPIVLEAGPTVGHAIRQWDHVQLFSPWGYNIDKAAKRLLEPTGWNSPDPKQYPAGGELLEQYLEPLASRTALSEYIRTSSRVTGISRVGFDKLKTKGRAAAQFELRYQNGQGPNSIRADAVIDASGTWFTPNPAGGNGLPALGERENAAQLAYGMPDVLGKDRPRYAGKEIAVLGAGHSAVGTLIELNRLKSHAPGTEVIWVVRGENPEKAFGGGVNDRLLARGELGMALAALVKAGAIRVETGFPLMRIDREGGRIKLLASGCPGRTVAADELVVATGFRSNLDFVRELRIQLDPAIECPIALAPLIDPNEHSCGTVRPHGAAELAQEEPDFYFAGMKSYGRAPTFLMLTGYEQVRSIAAKIAGDHAAARRVELVLPETGVCSRATARAEAECCGGPAVARADACGAADDTAKVTGKAGCGCGTAA
jgi:thioredoxin reductase